MSQRTPLTVKRQLTLGFGGLALASVLVAGMAARGLDAGNEQRGEAYHLRNCFLAHLHHLFP